MDWSIEAKSHSKFLNQMCRKPGCFSHASWQYDYKNEHCKTVFVLRAQCIHRQSPLPCQHQKVMLETEVQQVWLFQILMSQMLSIVRLSWTDQLWCCDSSHPVYTVQNSTGTFITSSFQPVLKGHFNYYKFWLYQAHGPNCCDIYCQRPIFRTHEQQN